MDLYIVRHGSYNPKHIDPTEGLSDIGKEEVAKLREFFDQEKTSFDVVLCSPKIRAKETASILCGGRPITETTDLAPSSSVEKALSCLPTSGTVLAVSHLPLLDGLAEKLGEHVEFKPATMAHFSDEGLKNIIVPS